MQRILYWIRNLKNFLILNKKQQERGRPECSSCFCLRELCQRYKKLPDTKTKNTERGFHIHLSINGVQHSGFCNASAATRVCGCWWFGMEGPWNSRAKLTVSLSHTVETTRLHQCYYLSWLDSHSAEGRGLLCPSRVWKGHRASALTWNVLLQTRRLPIDRFLPSLKLLSSFSCVLFVKLKLSSTAVLF